MKILVLFILVMMIPLAVTSAGVKVNDPNGGETLYLGNNLLITWDTGGSGGQVMIKMRQNGSLAGEIVNSTYNDGGHLWKIDKYSNGSPVKVGEKYQIKIIHKENNTNHDISDGFFKIKRRLMVHTDVLKKIKKNTLVHAGNLIPLQPDLWVDISHTYSSPSQPARFIFTIHNSGQVTSGSCKLFIRLSYLGTSNSGSGNSVEWWEVNSIPSIPKNDTHVHTITYHSLNPETFDRWFKLWASIDPPNSTIQGDQVKEKDETNNIKTYSFMIPGV